MPDLWLSHTFCFASFCLIATGLFYFFFISGLSQEGIQHKTYRNRFFIYNMEFFFLLLYLRVGECVCVFFYRVLSVLLSLHPSPHNLFAGNFRSHTNTSFVDLALGSTKAPAFVVPIGYKNKISYHKKRWLANQPYHQQTHLIQWYYWISNNLGNQNLWFILRIETSVLAFFPPRPRFSLLGWRRFFSLWCALSGPNIKENYS